MDSRILINLACLGLVACSQGFSKGTANPEEIPASTPLARAASANTNVTELPVVSTRKSLAAPKLEETVWTHGLLQTSQYHGDEVTATSQEQWWGLFVTDEGFELRPTTLTVKIVRDPLLDSETGPFTGKEVVTDQELPSVFLVKGPTMFAPGPVKTVFFGATNIPVQAPDHHAPTLSLSLNTAEGLERYELSLEAVADHEISRTVLSFFESGEQLTQQYELEGCCDRHGPNLIWAGDLDRDGKLDFLLDVTNHYNVSAPTLFLSSPTQNHEIVQPVAQIRSVGC